MNTKLQSHLLVAAIFAFGMSAIGETQIFVARHSAGLEGAYNQGRVQINATFDGTSQAQWGQRGNSGLEGDGRIWQGFARYKMSDRDLFNAVDSAGKITWTTGLIQKEINRAIDPINGGHDVDFYLSLDPDGQFIPSGELPSIFNAWDWSNAFGWGYENRVYLGRVLQSEPMATLAEKSAENQIPLDSPAMRITFDVTDAIKDWINQGLLTADSTIAFGWVQLAAEIVDEFGNPKFDDPNLYVHNQMVFEVGTAYIKTEPADGPQMGPGVFSDFELVDGWVDSGDWMGWVEVTNYPWSYVLDLARYAWVSEAAGWVYVQK